MSLDRVGQSPLKAFIQSPLKARTIEVAAGQGVVFSLNSQGRLYAFDSSTLSLLLGPLDLNQNRNLFAVECDDAMESYYVVWSGFVAKYDTAGVVQWEDPPAKDQDVRGRAELSQQGWLFNARRGGVGDEAYIDIRNPATGAVLLTEQVAVTTIPPFEISPMLHVNGTTCVVYTFEGEFASTIKTTLYAYDIGGSGMSPTLTLSTSRVLHDGPFTGEFNSGLYGETPTIYSPAFNAVLDWIRMDAFNPDLTDGVDYTVQHPTNISGFISLDSNFYEVLGDFIERFDIGGTFLARSEQVGVPGVGVTSARQVTLSTAIALDPVADVVRDDSPYSQQLTAAAGIPDTWLLLLGPPGATISATGLVEWSSPTVRAGGNPWDFRGYARAATGGWDMVRWFVTIVAVAPVITEIIDDGTNVGFTYTENPTLDAGDPPVTWSLDVQPSNGSGSIDPNTGAISWVFTASGSYDWTVRATNAKGFDTESWSTLVF